ncbi:MAG: aminomethyl-transferring glycine dehydrogenase, partial [Chloroflexi bacterium]|nr:aminomethyl-transferring glycine dehydrogenase [Chloroflexota bacterium]
ILYRARYAMQEIGKIKGVRSDVFSAPHFKEFVVNFDGTGRKVAELNAALLRKGIFGGKDLSREFPWLGESALVCVTEIHTQEDIDRLVSSLKEVLS